MSLEDRETPPGIDEAVSPAHTAILVHDMQNDFCTQGGKIFKRAAKRPETIEAVVKDIATLVRAGRKAGVKIVYLQQFHLPDLADIPVSHVHHLKLNGLAGTADDVPCIRGSWGHRIVDALKPEPGDIVVDKGAFNDFHNSMLDKVLRIQGVETALLTGVSSHSGIMGTFFGLLDHGYHFYIPRECVMGYDAEMHEAAMRIYRQHTAARDDILSAWTKPRAAG